MVVIKSKDKENIGSPRSPLYAYVFEPKTEGVYQETTYPGLILLPDHLKYTPGVERMSKWLAGHGYVIFVPELSYAPSSEHSSEPKKTFKLSLESDIQGLVKSLSAHPQCSGRVGIIGLGTGGHIAIHAALNPDILATAIFFPVGVQSGTIYDENTDTLELLNNIKGELVFLWARQDSLTSNEERIQIYRTLQPSQVKFSWHEVNAEHSYLEDTAGTYDPAESHLSYNIIFDLFNRTL